MRLDKLIIKAADLVLDAGIAMHTKGPSAPWKVLAELRKLLNDQPALKAWEIAETPPAERTQ
ncbi:hypothetical protein ES703_24794 [subsurface metagenome]